MGTSDTAGVGDIPDVSSQAKRIALALLLLMTIGFGIYQFAVISGLTEPFLGGYLGLAGAVLFGPAVFIYVHQIAIAPWRFNRGDLLFILFVSMIAGWAIPNYFLDGAEETAFDHFAVLPELLVFFVAFRFIDLRRASDQRMVAAAFVVMAGIILSLGLGDGIAASQVALGIDPDDVGGYQAFGMLYSLLIVCCACFSQRMTVRVLVYAVGVFALFHNGARSETIACIPMIAAIEAHFSRGAPIILFATAAALLLFFADLVTALNAMFPNNRVVFLLDNLSYDSSWVERKYLRDVAITVIQESPLFGEYGYYPKGQYSHDLLSVWADFGIFGFLLFLACLALPLLAVWRNYIGGTVNPEALALAAFSVTGLALYTFSKYYTHPTIVIMLALYAKDLNARRVKEAFRLHARI